MTIETKHAPDPSADDSSETFWSAQDHSGAMPESRVVQQDEVEEQDDGINKDDNRSYPGEDREPEPFSTPEKGSSAPRRRSASRCPATKTFSKLTPYWSDCNGIWQFDDNNKDTALSEFAFEQFGGTNFNKLKWRSGLWKPRMSHGNKRRVHRCGFSHASGCKYVMEELYSFSTERTCFREGIVPHTNHDKILGDLTAVPPQVKACVNSPTILRMKTSTFLQHLSTKGIVTLDTKMRNKVRTYFCALKLQYAKSHLNESVSGTYGALAETSNQMKREFVGAADFNDHTVYLLGNRYFVDSDNKRFYAVLSTDNLLLNAYRQTCMGQDMFIAIDTSYRYTIGGYALMPVYTVSPNQKGKRLCYAIVSNKDKYAHTKILEILKEGVKEVVDRKIEEEQASI